MENRRKALIITATVVTAALWVFIFNSLGRPWVYALAVVAVYCAGMTFLLRHPFFRALFLNLCVLALALAGFEFYFTSQNEYSQHKYERIYENKSGKHFVVKDPVTGFSSLPSEKTRAVRTMDGHKVYDVTYTTDSLGRRVTYPPVGNPDTALIFFGCSFTFSVGVNDEDSIPWLVGKYTNGRYAVYNYGGYGYGPHQMLALLENGLDPEIARYKRVLVFYNLLDLHVQRSAGLAEWDRSGPRYLLKNGKLVRSGTFADNIKLIDDRWAGKLEFWETLRRVELGIQRFFSPAGRTTAEHEKLLAAILEKSGQEVAKAYPGGKFTVFVWPGSEHLEPLLQDAKVSYVSLAPLLPEDFTHNAEKYFIANDGHPNPEGTSAAARAMVDYINELMP